jgi:hypothetical protein
VLVRALQGESLQGMYCFHMVSFVYGPKTVWCPFVVDTCSELQMPGLNNGHAECIKTKDFSSMLEIRGGE